MKRIDSINARPNMFGTGKKGFHANDDVPGQDATYLTPDWCNTIQEEIVNLLELRGIKLNPESNRQLFDVLAGRDDLANLLSSVQELVSNEREARIAAAQAHLDASNPHSQYVLRKDFRLLYRDLTPETTVHPVVYKENPSKWTVGHTVENISVHIMPNGYTEQTLKVRTVYGDYDAQVYLPMALSNILNVSAVYQAQGRWNNDNHDFEDDSSIRLLDIYDEVVQTSDLQERRTVVNFRFDYVSGNTAHNQERFAYIRVSGFGSSNTDIVNLNRYPYPYYTSQNDASGQVVYIDQDLTNVNLLDLFIQTYGAPTTTTQATFVIAGNSTVTSIVSGNWLSGSSRQIINYGHIYGMGGSGGYFDGDTAMVGDGGTAIVSQNNSSFINVKNYGLIAGGGGGGAAGKSQYTVGDKKYHAVGGGGGGAPFGTGGSSINQTAPEDHTLVNSFGETATLKTNGQGFVGTGLTAGSGGLVGENGHASNSTLTNGKSGLVGFISQGNVTITNIANGQTKGR